MRGTAKATGDAGEPRPGDCDTKAGTGDRAGRLYLFQRLDHVGHPHTLSVRPAAIHVEPVTYPRETRHEILTNAVPHRDSMDYDSAGGPS